MVLAVTLNAPERASTAGIISISNPTATNVPAVAASAPRWLVLVIFFPAPFTQGGVIRPAVLYYGDSISGYKGWRTFRELHASTTSMNKSAR